LERALSQMSPQPLSSLQMAFNLVHLGWPVAISKCRHRRSGLRSSRAECPCKLNQRLLDLMQKSILSFKKSWLTMRSDHYCSNNGQ
jgi:hypothetical protein